MTSIFDCWAIDLPSRETMYHNNLRQMWRKVTSWFLFCWMANRDTASAVHVARGGEKDLFFSPRYFYLRVVLGGWESIMWNYLELCWKFDKFIALSWFCCTIFPQYQWMIHKAKSIFLRSDQSSAWILPNSAIDGKAPGLNTFRKNICFVINNEFCQLATVRLRNTKQFVSGRPDLRSISSNNLKRWRFAFGWTNLSQQTHRDFPAAKSNSERYK